MERWSRNCRLRLTFICSILVHITILRLCCELYQCCNGAYTHQIVTIDLDNVAEGLGQHWFGCQITVSEDEVIIWGT